MKKTPLILLTFAGFTLVCFLYSGKLHGQDIHYSFLNLAPLEMNPAMAGSFEGQYRFIGNYKRQWASISAPYRTFGLSMEGRSIIKKLPSLHMGLSIYSDLAGDSKYGTTQIQWSPSYQIPWPSDSNTTLNIGAGFQFSQSKIDYSQLFFDEQYNGYAYQNNLNNGEQFPQGDQKWYFNSSVGLFIKKKIEPRKTLSAGLSLMNLNTPNTSFNSQEKKGLYRRFTFLAIAEWKIKEKTDLIPKIILQGQGKYFEMIPNIDLRYHLTSNPYHQMALYGGLGTRALDALISSVGLDYDEWHFRLVYDFNYSLLRPASLGRGGIEFHLHYIIRQAAPKIKPHKICPDYL